VFSLDDCLLENTILNDGPNQPPYKLAIPVAAGLTGVKFEAKPPGCSGVVGRESAIATFAKFVGRTKGSRRYGATMTP